MLPFMAQGAAQAIEDGATLAACLENAAFDIPTAFQAYVASRKPRTTIFARAIPCPFYELPSA
jgi:salicylate hydroxylase